MTAHALPGPLLRRLSRPSTPAGLARIGLHAGLIGIAAGLVLAARGSWAVWPAMALLGVLEVSLFAGLHEAVHRTAFAGRRANLALAWACGLVLGLGPTHFRLYHLAHHRHTQDPARDPELSSPKPTSRAGYLWALSGLPVWWSTLSGLVRRTAGRVDEAFVPADKSNTVVREARTMLLAYAGILGVAGAAGSALPLLLWIGPVLLGQPALRAFLMAEHTGCPLTPDMLANSRTTLTSRLVRLLTWNMSFHAEHHAAPTVPFHRLAEVHRHLTGRHGMLDHGYGRVHARLWRALATHTRARASL